MGFRKKAISLGVQYIADEVVSLGLNSDKRRLESILLGSGSNIRVNSVVNACGSSSGQLASLINVYLPVVHKKRCVFVLDTPRRKEITQCPLVIDTSGVYWRPEGEHFICGVSPPPQEDPDVDPYDFTVTHQIFEEIIWPALAHRVPAFEAVKVVRSWAGHYDYNKLDQNAILGPHPSIDNFFFANGFSGHGLQQAPAVGRAIAEYLIHGKYQTLDLGCFSFERVLSNRPILELNIV